MGITCCKGMRDILPAEMDSWYHLEEIAFRLARTYGYKEIRTPFFELKELFTSCIGRDSGTVQSKLWTLKGPAGENWVLRPDMTASTLRAYCENRLYLEAEGPTKLYYFGPVFQHNGGRKSINWQGYQFGVEALGTGDPISDAEVIMMACDLCHGLELPEVCVHLNTLGCSHCRPAYQQMLSEFLASHSSSLCSVCQSRYKNRPLWVLGCHDDKCRELTSMVPSIHGYLCEECLAHFKTLCSYLSELKVDYIVDPLTVRDVDCYCRTIFQVACAGRMVAFGGRYDGMGQRALETDSEVGPIQAVGCSMDIEPLLNLVDEMQIPISSAPSAPMVCFVGESPEAVQLMMPVLYALRRRRIAAEMRRDEEIATLPRSCSLSRFVVVLRDTDVRGRMVKFIDNGVKKAERMGLENAIAIICRELKLKNLSAELRPQDNRNWPIATRSHHTLDSSRAKRASEPKARQSRHAGLKYDQLGSLRDSRGRKAPYPVLAHDKGLSSRERKRRNPEAEDSMEAAKGVAPYRNGRTRSYPEPMVSHSQHDKKGLASHKALGNSMAVVPLAPASLGRSHGSEDEQYLYIHDDMLGHRKAGNAVRGSEGGRRHKMTGVGSSTSPLDFSVYDDGLEGSYVYPNEAAQDALATARGKHSRRRGAGEANYNVGGYHDIVLQNTEYGEFLPLSSDGDGRERASSGVLQRAALWNAERYGDGDEADYLAFGSDSHGSPRSGRQSLARNRRLKEQAAASGADKAHQKAELADEKLADSVFAGDEMAKKDIADSSMAKAVPAEDVSADLDAPGESADKKSAKRAAPKKPAKQAADKRRNTSSKRQSSGKAKAEANDKLTAEVPPCLESDSSADKQAADMIVAAIAAAEERPEIKAELLAEEAEPSAVASKPKGRRAAAAGKTVKAKRTTSTVRGRKNAAKALAADDIEQAVQQSGNGEQAPPAGGAEPEE
ncbi:ATP phosphoribosyltransferase regulatory subunit [bacterium]|nr:ATP phosphoribosyltransferase regulatory subunit [bacterium]